MIYAVKILDGKFIKIGFAENVQLRIGDLQTGNPFQIILIFSVEGTLRQEKSIHAALSMSFGRIRLPMPPNEWYPGLHPFFQEFLDSLRHGGSNQGIAFLEQWNPAVNPISTRVGLQRIDPN